MSGQSFATHTTIQPTSSDRRGVVDRRYVTAALMLVMVPAFLFLRSARTKGEARIMSAHAE